MRGILCFNSKPCPFRGEYRGEDQLGVSANPRPFFACNAESLEQMRACILSEDKDLNKYGFKVLVNREDGAVAWEPNKTVIHRQDTDEVLDGSAFEV